VRLTGDWFGFRDEMGKKGVRGGHRPVKPLPGTAMTVTERAYTSPIWYTPTR
jgi:hypothetical protein